MIALQRQVCRLQTLRIAERKGDGLRRDVDVAIREILDVIMSLRPVPPAQPDEVDRDV